MSTENLQIDDAETLLPFYVNGTLEPESREIVDAELSANPGLNDELKALSNLRETMQQLDFGTSPGQFGLARVLRDIDELEQKKPSKPVLPWSIAVAAVAALIAVGTAWMADLGAPHYKYVSDPDENLLTVAFQPEATQAEISDLLLELQLEIKKGPTAIGLYKLASDQQSDLNELAIQLRDRRDLIESVDMP